MSFTLSDNFHKHWLNAPASTRMHIKDDLQALILLLKPETSVLKWQKEYGSYFKDTTKAQQVGLFGEDDNDIAYTPATQFLKSVTADTQANKAIAKPKKIRKKVAKTNTVNLQATKITASKNKQQPLELASEIDKLIDDHLHPVLESVKKEITANVVAMLRKDSSKEKSTDKKEPQIGIF